MMAETQYALFRDLDRHCVAGGMGESDCIAAVRRKRECITAPFNRENPLVREVLEGRTTFTAIYDEYSLGYRGVRRFLPVPHNEAYNQRLEHFEKIVPNVRHFQRRSVFATDNPLTCALYGIIASLAFAAIWAHAAARDSDTGNASDEVGSMTLISLVTIGGLVGFLVGIFAMLKYRTRNPRTIHAREAAAYLDFNYQCHRALDDKAWARLVALKTTPAPGTASCLACSPEATPDHQRHPAAS